MQIRISNFKHSTYSFQQHTTIKWNLFGTHFLNGFENGLLSLVGFQSYITNNEGLLYKEGRLMLVGLDSAGKTTLLGVLKNGRLKACNPTFHAIKEELVIQSIKFTCFDLGGHPEVRRIWRDYYPTTSAIVFVVDAADQSRLDEAKDELQGILKNEDIKEVPILILGNKIDSPSALSEEELKIRLGLVQSTTGKVMRLVHSIESVQDADPISIKQRHIRPIEVFMCSIIQRVGFGEGIVVFHLEGNQSTGFRWLSQYL